MKKIELVVFDMAGTTVHDRGNVADAFMHACKSHGFEISHEEAQKVMGFRKIDAVKMLLDKLYPGSATPELINGIHETFTDSMIRFYEEDKELAPLPHAVEIFNWLKAKNIRRALNTGFTKPITDVIVRRLNWENHGLIDCVISSDEVPHGRPAPDMIFSVMKSFNIPNADSVVKVGDTQVDVEEGRNAGCAYVVAVTTGAYSREQLEKYNPDFTIDDLNELKAIIDQQ